VNVYAAIDSRDQLGEHPFGDLDLYVDWHTAAS
jgi:hypothetical protein